MTDERREIDMAVEVVGTPEQVWEAIATGPGISSWYVPHQVEEREGGVMGAQFGTAPEMQVEGRVAAWDPPHRVVFDGGDPSEGLVFEWLVEARDGGTCIVRLVNSGFGNGDEWDAQYDGMAEGWKIFMLNLQLHLEHFAGQTATASLPMTGFAGDPKELWPTMAAALGAPAQPDKGSRVSLHAGEGLELAGTVVEVGASRMTLLVDAPAPGVAFVALEGMGDHVGASIWSYLYGEEGNAIAERDGARWQSWLDQFSGGLS